MNNSWDYPHERDGHSAWRIDGMRSSPRELPLPPPRSYQPAIVYHYADRTEEEVEEDRRLGSRRYFPRLPEAAAPVASSQSNNPYRRATRRLEEGSHYREARRPQEDHHRRGSPSSSITNPFYSRHPNSPRAWLSSFDFEPPSRPRNYPSMGSIVEDSVREGSTVGDIYNHYGSTSTPKCETDQHRTSNTEVLENDQGGQDVARTPTASDHAAVWANVSDRNASGEELVSSTGNMMGSMPRSEGMMDLRSEASHSDLASQPSVPVLETVTVENMVMNELRHLSGVSTGSIVAAEHKEIRNKLTTKYLSMMDAKNSSQPSEDAPANGEHLHKSKMVKSAQAISRLLSEKPLTNDEYQSSYGRAIYDPRTAQRAARDKHGLLTVPSARLKPSPLSTSAISSANSESQLIAGSERTEDGDWETVVSSNKNLENLGPSIFGAKRCGDSIADVSDEGGLDDFELQTPPNGFMTTEKVTVHPSNGKFHGKFLQRFVQRGNTPVLLPSYDEHRVNGYSADSSRVQPHPKQFHSSPPLKQAHRNPFKSTPPDVTPVGKRSRSANHFPRRSRTKEAVYGENGESSQWDADPTAGLSTEATMSSTPIVKKRRVDEPIRYGAGGFPTSDHHHFRTDSPGQDSSIHSENPNISTDGLTGRESPVLSLPKPTYNKSKPRVFGGSRGFFQPSDEKRRRSAMKTFAGDHEMRPRMLLNDPDLESQMSIAKSGRDLNGAIEMDDFVYTDPRSPVRNKNWKQLYPENEPTRVQNGEASGSRPVPQTQRVNRLKETPQLRRKSKVPWYSGNLRRQQIIWSDSIFWMCIFAFPFSLILLPCYALGHLDWLVQDRSENQVMCMSSEKKRLAAFAGLVYWIIAIAGIVVGIIFGLKHGH